MHSSDNTGQAIPYRADQHFGLIAIGRWKTGGILEIYFESQLLDRVILPQAEWAVVALLVQAAERSKSNWTAAYLNADELTHGLERKTDLQDLDNQKIFTYVYKVRQMLKHTDAAKLAVHKFGDDVPWPKLLLEKHKRLGYRLSLPPENVRVRFLGNENPEESS